MARRQVRVLGTTNQVGWVVGTSTVAPGYPPAILPGHVVYLIIHSKSSSNATPSTPSNWTLVGTATGGAGSFGGGTGPTRITVFRRIVPSGGLTGSQTVSISGSTPVAVAYMSPFRAESGTSIEYEETFASWSKTSTSSTAFGGTASNGLDVLDGDQLLVIFGATDDDVGAITSVGITATGAGFTGFAHEANDDAIGTGTGNDLFADSFRTEVFTGSSDAPPVITGTGVVGRSGMGFVLRVQATAEYVDATLATAGDVVVEGLPLTMHNLHLLDRGDVVVEGTSVTTESIPRVHMRLDIGEIVVESNPTVLHKVVHLGNPGEIQVEGAGVELAHRLDIGIGDVVVEPLSVSIVGRLEIPGVVVEGLPVQISYGSSGPGGQGGLIGIPPSNSTRFIAQSILTGEFIHWDLPVVDPTITLTLSGPTSITGSLDPEDPALADLMTVGLNAGGLEPWACWIHVETDGYIVASGILQPWQVDGEAISLEASGVSAYPHGVPYLGEMSGIQVDPADIVRAIWTHLQSYPDGRLNVLVFGETPIKLGTPEYTQPKLGASGQPEKDEDGNVIMETVEAEPYELMWWEGPDCGSEIDSLAGSTPFDYIERCAWNADHSGVDHWIELGYPRIGARRDDLRFATGENVIGAIPAEEMDDQYASQVVVFGKGEGRSIVRGYAGRPVRKRLRRVAIVQDGTIATNSRATANAADDLERRQVLTDVTDLEIDARHINAEFGTYGPGDDIPIDVEVSWLGRLRQYERILSVTYSPDQESVRLQLRRSESFRYGSV